MDKTFFAKLLCKSNNPRGSGSGRIFALPLPQKKDRFHHFRFQLPLLLPHPWSEQESDSQFENFLDPDPDSRIFGTGVESEFEKVTPVSSGKCPGLCVFCGLPLEYQNAPLLVFLVFGCSPCVEIVELLLTAFSSLCRLRKLTTLAIMVFR